MSQFEDRPIVTASTCMGIGLGGFVDGILFHQILQVHNMLSNVVPKIDLVNMEINMFWDGLFHAFCFVMVLIGISLLWRAVKREEVPKETRTVIGSMILGWGLFNLIEGIIDHHVLQIHHVMEIYGLSPFDWGFLGSGVLFIVIGTRLIRTARNRTNLSRPQGLRVA